MARPWVVIVASVVSATGLAATPAFGQPVRIATGGDPSLDGHLDVAPDEYGSYAVPFAGGEGPNDEHFNPAGPFDLAQAAFTSGFFLFTDAGRELLSDNADWQAVLPADASLDREVLEPNTATDVDLDGTVDTLTSAFRIFGVGVGVDLHVDLVQRVVPVVPGVTSLLVQEYVVSNLGPDDVAITLVRSFDGDLVWVGTVFDDEVGTGTNTMPPVVGRFVFEREVATPATGIALSCSRGDAYFGGKHGLTPGGGPPAYDFGTDTEIWEDFGLPGSWRNHVAGVGYDLDGASGASPPGSTSPRDAFIGLDVPLELVSGAVAGLVVIHTYGADMPLGGLAPDDCETDTAAASLDDAIGMLGWVRIRTLGAELGMASADATVGLSLASLESAAAAGGSAITHLGNADGALADVSTQLDTATASGEAAAIAIDEAVMRVNGSVAPTMEAAMTYAIARKLALACGPCSEPTMPLFDALDENLDGISPQQGAAVEHLEGAKMQVEEANAQELDANGQTIRARQQNAEAAEQTAQAQTQQRAAATQKNNARIQLQHAQSQHHAAGIQLDDAIMQYEQSKSQLLTFPPEVVRSISKILRAQGQEDRAAEENDRGEEVGDRAQDQIDRAKQQEQRAKEQKERAAGLVERAKGQSERAEGQIARAMEKKQRSQEKLTAATTEQDRALAKFERVFEQAQSIETILTDCGPCGEPALMAMIDARGHAELAHAELSQASASTAGAAAAVDESIGAIGAALGSMGIGLGETDLALGDLADAIADAASSLDHTDTALHQADQAGAEIQAARPTHRVVRAVTDNVLALVGGCCPTDTDGNGMTDVDDLLAVILAWGSDDPAADVNDDGIVNVDDLVAVVLAWGALPVRTIASTR